MENLKELFVNSFLLHFFKKQPSITIKEVDTIKSKINLSRDIYARYLNGGVEKITT